MFRPIAIAAATMIALPLTALPLAAQDAEEGTAGIKDTRNDTYLQSVDDTKVMNMNGEEIGEIEEILVDADGKPAGFLIEMGGWSNLLKQSEVGVPLEALEWNGSAYVSKMTEEQLERLQPFDE